MTNRFSTKLMLVSMRDEIKKALNRGERPLHAIKLYHDKLAKYKLDFKDEHDQEVQKHDQEIKNIVKDFNGEVIN